MLLVSWNVAGRTTRLDEQAGRVLELEPDFLCLEEVTPVTAERWLGWLADAGLGGVLDSLPQARGQPAVDGAHGLARCRRGAADSQCPLAGARPRRPGEPARGREPPLAGEPEAGPCVTECAYRHDWRREDRLSDHSALVAPLSVRA